MYKKLIAIAALGLVAIAWFAMTTEPDGPYDLRGTYAVERWAPNTPASSPPDFTGEITLSPLGPGWQCTGIINGIPINGSGMYEETDGTYGFSLASEEAMAIVSVFMKPEADRMIGHWSLIATPWKQNEQPSDSNQSGREIWTLRQ